MGATIYTVKLRGQREFEVTFEYLRKSFVHVTLRGVNNYKILNPISDYVFSTQNTITTNRTWTIEDGFDRIEIRRVTPADVRLVDFKDGSILTAKFLNASYVQTLHIAEEGRDLASYSVSLTPSSNLDASNRRIVNVVDPVDPQDVATKHYVDDIAGIVHDDMLNAQQAAKDAEMFANNVRPDLIPYTPLRKCKVHTILKYEIPHFYPQGVVFDNKDRHFYLICSSSGKGEKLLVAKMSEEGSLLESKELQRPEGVSFYFGEGAQIVRNDGNINFIVTAYKDASQEFGVVIFNYTANSCKFVLLPYVTTSQICTSSYDVFGVEERLFIRYGTYTRFRFYKASEFVKGTIREIGQIEMESDLGTEGKIQSTCLMGGSIYSGIGKTTAGVIKFSMDGNILESASWSIDTLKELCASKVNISDYKSRYTENEGIGSIMIGNREYLYTLNIMETNSSNQHCVILLHNVNESGVLLPDSTVLKQTTMTQFAPFIIKDEYPKNLKYYIDNLISRKVYYGALYTSNLPIKWSNTQPFILPNYCYVEFKMNNLITCTVDIHCDDGLIILQYLKTKGIFRLVQGLTKNILMDSADLWGPTPIDLAHTTDLRIKIYPFADQGGSILDFKTKFINVPAGAKVTLIKSTSPSTSNNKIKGILSRDTIDSQTLNLAGPNYPLISAVCMDKSSKGYNWYKTEDTTVSVAK